MRDTSSKKEPNTMKNNQERSEINKEDNKVSKLQNSINEVQKDSLISKINEKKVRNETDE